MYSPRRSDNGLLSGHPSPQTAHLHRTVRHDGQLQRSRPLTRKYEVAHLSTPDPSMPQTICEFSRTAPATPMFEDAFAAVARGSLISTTNGLVAVEDLLPGDQLETVGHGPQTLHWIGAMTLFPNVTGDADAGQLLRVSADSFGIGRPMPDLILGPRARLFYRNSACLSLVGSETAFAPAHAFADGNSVTAVTPVSPVLVFHLGLNGQHIIRANGLEIESYHPGSHTDILPDRETMGLFMTLFPHLNTFRDFGPLRTPRLTAFEIEDMQAA
jgi:hypothetical protein